MANRMRGSIAAVSLGLMAGIATAAPQPIENFARMPQMRDVAISPDGHYVTFISALDDASVVMTFDANTNGTFQRIAASEPGRFDVEHCGWANNERVICSLTGNLRSGKYADVPFFRTMAVDANGANIKTLDVQAEKGNMMARTTTPQNLNGATAIGKVGGTAGSGNYGFRVYGQKSISMFDYFGGQRSDQVLGILPGEHERVLIQTNYEGNSYPSVVSLNVYTGRREVRLRANPPIRNFLTDARGAVVMGWGVSGKLEASYFSRDASGGDWSPLTKLAGFTGDKPMLPLGVAPTEKIAYAFADFEGRRALWSIDLADQRDPEVLVKHASVDVGNPLQTNDRRFFGVRYDLERPLAYYSDQSLSEKVKEINAQLMRFSMVVDMTADEKTLVLKSFNDTDEATYYLFNRDENKLKRLGQAYPELKPESLGSMKPIKYKAADGTEIRGYLTLPNGAAAEKLPLVVLPHDGPGERDFWEFSYLRNFLANRGYAVLQMNFRGSAGYGQAWKNGARGLWGTVPYSDIADGARWAVAQGIADPKRICIAGTGFGGYAALLGAERNSDLFRCSISINGISDLQMLKDDAAIFGPADEAHLAEQVGSDKNALSQQSPVENATGISIPVLLVHGDMDWKVQIDHSRKMESELKKLKKDYKAVYIKGAGHELDRKSDRMTLLKEVEDFLQKNIGASAH